MDTQRKARHVALCPYITHISALVSVLKIIQYSVISICLALDISNEYPGLNLEPPAFAWS